MNRRRTLRAIGGVGLGLLAGCLSSDGPEGSPTAGPTLAGSPSIASPAFDEGDAIPSRYTCEGEDVSPRLEVASVPPEAAELALLVDDPDAPGGTFTHWLLWGLPPDAAAVPEDVPRGETVTDLGGARQGTNDAGVVGYSGPCPPPDDDAHTYRFRLFALDEPLGLEAGSDREPFDRALGGVATAEGRLSAEYDR